MFYVSSIPVITFYKAIYFILVLLICLHNSVSGPGDKTTALMGFLGASLYHAHMKKTLGMRKK